MGFPLIRIPPNYRSLVFDSQLFIVADNADDNTQTADNNTSADYQR